MPFRSENVVVDSLSSSRFWSVLVLGCLIGIGVYFLSEKEIRWMMVPVLALAGGIFLLVVPEKKTVLTALFVLSFQVDIYLRFLYGRAGSTEGLALPLVVIAGSLLAGWHYLFGNTRHFKWGGSVGLPILAFLTIAAISAMFSSERFVGLTTLLYLVEYYFLYWLAFNIIRSADDFRRVVALLFIVLGIQASVYFVQSALGVTFDFLGNTIEGGEVPRPGGTVSTNPAGFVSFIMPALMMASAIALSKFRNVLSKFSLLLMLMGVGAVGLSFTRAAWIGLVFGFVVIGLIGSRQKWINRRMTIVVFSVFLIGAVVLLPKMLQRVSSDYRVSDSGSASETLNERMGLNKIAFNVIMNHPLLGVGPGAYSHVYKEYVPARLNQWLYTVHNTYLLWAAEIGIAGGLFFICIIATGLRVAFRLSRSPTTIVSICATGWFGAVVVLSWMMFWVPWTGFSYNGMLWFMLGVMDGAERLVRSA